MKASDAVYGDVITEFFFQESFPNLEVSDDVKFEVLSREVLGTKQRRNGPLPKAEMQVMIREVLRKSDNDEINFFIPWGCSKQEENVNFDILEYCAIKQLHCLKKAIERCDKKAVFWVRLEDCTDLVLFGPSREAAIDKYGMTFEDVASDTVDHIQWESDDVPFADFLDKVGDLQHTILGYLNGSKSLCELHKIGWKGDIPANQRAHYEKTYKMFYPDKNPTLMMSRYFASCLAKIHLKATYTPKNKGGENLPYIQINFNGPIPGNPVVRPSVYYRSMPEKYTHQHRTPWNGKGYLQISEKDGQNCVCPKAAGVGEKHEYIKNTLEINGAIIECDYVLKGE